MKGRFGIHGGGFLLLIGLLGVLLCGGCGGGGDDPEPLPSGWFEGVWDMTGGEGTLTSSDGSLSWTLRLRSGTCRLALVTEREADMDIRGEVLSERDIYDGNGTRVGPLTRTWAPNLVAVQKVGTNGFRVEYGDTLLEMTALSATEARVTERGGAEQNGISVTYSGTYLLRKRE